MGTKTWYDLIIEVLMTKKMPLQRKDLLTELINKQDETNVTLDDLHLGLTLSQLCSKNKLSMYKVEGFPSFYCIPSWFKRDGNLLIEYEIDPYTKQLKHNSNAHKSI